MTRAERLASRNVGKVTVPLIDENDQPAGEVLFALRRETIELYDQARGGVMLGILARDRFTPWLRAGSGPHIEDDLLLFRNVYALWVFDQQTQTWLRAECDAEAELRYRVCGLAAAAS